MMNSKIIFIVLTVFSLCLQNTEAQTYFSELKYNVHGSMDFLGIEKIEDDLYFIPVAKELREEGLFLSGWYLMNGGGIFIDSFFFETKGLVSGSIPSRNHLIRDGLVYQVFGFNFDGIPKFLNVSSIEDRDSVASYPIEFNRPEWEHINIASATISSEDYILIIGTGTRAGSPRIWDVFMLKMDFEGNILLLRDIEQFPDDTNNYTYNFYNWVMCNIIELDGCFYFTNSASNGLYMHSYVYKIDSEGNLIWRSELNTKGSSEQATAPNLILLPDSSAIAWTNNRQIEPSDVGGDQMKWFYSSPHPAIITILDTLDGSEIDTYLKRYPRLGDDGAGIDITIRSIITSADNGDFIICGIYTDYEFFHHDYPFTSFLNPMVGRVSQDGEYKWIKYIMERWGDDAIGFECYGITEANNGDILLTGSTHRWTLETFEPAFVMRIGPDGCVPGVTFCSGDTLSINHPLLIVSTTDLEDEQEDLNIWPNPLAAGDFLNIATDDGDFMSYGPGRLSWYGMDGRLYAQDVLNFVETRGYRAQVPPDLSPGHYIVELVAGNRRFRGKVVVR